MSVLDDVVQELESAGRSLVGLLLKEVDGFKHYLAVDLSAVGGGGVSHVVVPPTPAEAAVIQAATAPSQATMDELVAAVMARLQSASADKSPAPAPAAPTAPAIDATGLPTPAVEPTTP
jgi:hypothetical protein